MFVEGVRGTHQPESEGRGVFLGRHKIESGDTQILNKNQLFVDI